MEIVEHRDQFELEINADFYDWWRGLNRSQAPYWSQFDVVNHPRWATHLFLIRVERSDRFLYRFKLLGQSVIDLLGRNERLTTLDETGWDVQGGVASRAYDDMMAHRQPLRFFGTLQAYGKEYARFESVDAPFVDEAQAVTAVLGLICRTS